MPENNEERSAKAIDAYETLTTYDDLFSTTNNPFLYIIRILGWWIIRGLASLVGGVESIVNDLMSHINFFESAEVTGFMSTIRPIIWSLLLIGIVVLGYNLMFNRSEKKSQIPLLRWFNRRRSAFPRRSTCILTSPTPQAIICITPAE